MPRKPKQSKRDAILNAMLDVVVERGFHEAPMSVIAERAGASPGVIYHHFGSKEEIIQAVYQQVRAIKRATIMDGYSPEMSDEEGFVVAWMNAYRFYRDHIRELRFLDQYQAAGFEASPEMNEPPSPLQLEFQARYRPASEGGVLSDLPREVLSEMTFGLAIRLAKQPERLPAEVLRNTAERLWHSISG